MKHPLKDLSACYDQLLKDARASGKKIFGLHDQINYIFYLQNMSFRFLKEVNLDKLIMISTSNDPSFAQLARRDVNGGERTLLSISEMEDLDDATQKKILKHYFSIDDEFKTEFLREKTNSNFHILSHFRK